MHRLVDGLTETARMPMTEINDVLVSNLIGILFTQSLGTLFSHQQDLENISFGKLVPETWNCGNLHLKSQRGVQNSQIWLPLPICPSQLLHQSLLNYFTHERWCAEPKQENCIGNRLLGRSNAYRQGNQPNFDRNLHVGSEKELVNRDYDRELQRGVRNAPYVQRIRRRQAFEHQRGVIRRMVSTGNWLLNKARDGQVRPPKFLIGGKRCVLAELGECGDPTCGCYRLNTTTARVRPSFVDFCVDHILNSTSPEWKEKGITYCSLACGELYFDWELLERLIRKEGVKVRRVYLVDIVYSKRNEYYKEARRAISAFTDWFDKDFLIRSFPSSGDLLRQMAVGHCEEAHVLVQCDGSCLSHSNGSALDVDGFRKIALRTGGISLILYNPAQRELVRKLADGKTSTLISEQWFCGAWWNPSELESTDMDEMEDRDYTYTY